ncbi:MAG: DUF4266 domain-containing protein [Aquificota bacterium]|nr:MAG: DUF4266 domain-containing protein [Aquificota bacterium]
MKKTIVFLLMSSFLLTSCSEKLVRVLPFEREYFAQQKMQFDPVSSRSEQEGHVFLIREASAGGESSFQGGCGCR